MTIPSLPTEPDLEELVNCVLHKRVPFRLLINLRKTEELVQPARDLMLPDPTIAITGTQLNHMDTVIYLGSCITSIFRTDKEVSNSIAKVSVPFGRSTGLIWMKEAHEDLDSSL